MCYRIIILYERKRDERKRIGQDGKKLRGLREIERNGAYRRRIIERQR